MFVMKPILLTESELHNITMKKRIGIAYLQNRADQILKFFFFSVQVTVINGGRDNSSA